MQPGSLTPGTMATHARPVCTSVPARGLAPRRRQPLNLTPISKPYTRSASRGVARTNEQLALNSQATEREAAAGPPGTGSDNVELP